MRHSVADQPASTHRTSVDISYVANPELLDKFCYLGDMLTVDANATVEAIVMKGME